MPSPSILGGGYGGYSTNHYRYLDLLSGVDVVTHLGRHAAPIRVLLREEALPRVLVAADRFTVGLGCWPGGVWCTPQGTSSMYMDYYNNSCHEK